MKLILPVFMNKSLGWETLECRRQRIKSAFLYKGLIDYIARNLKQSLIGTVLC